jgi:formylmethanofuran dehydrogenase subunit C
METLVAPITKKQLFATGKFPRATKSCGILDKFSEQEEQGNEKKPQIITNGRIEAMRELFSKYKSISSNIALDNVYDLAVQLTNSIKYSSQDIALFSISLVHFQSEQFFVRGTGEFLSALINNSEDENFTIVTSNLSFPISNIGYKNTKNISIEGNAGNNVGVGMIRGAIHVNGNVGDTLGYKMDDGIITVNGNSKYQTGRDMNGGTIIINGDVDTQAGIWMNGGILIINGKCAHWLGNMMAGGTIIVNGIIKPSISDSLLKGNVFQFDRQLVDNGKRIADPIND